MGDAGKEDSTGTLLIDLLGILGREKTLLVYPITSFLICVLILAAVVSLFYRSLPSSDWEGPVGDFLVVYYLVSCAIIVYFNAAMVYHAKKWFAGEKGSLRDSFRKAGGRTGQLFVWSMISGTIGVVLGVIPFKFADDLSLGFFGSRWSASKTLIMPSIMSGKGSLTEAFRWSGNVFQDKWGDEAGGLYSFKPWILLSLAFGIVFSILLAAYGVYSDFLSIWVLTVYFLLAGIAGYGISSLYSAALYTFARTGECGGLRKELLEGAVRKKANAIDK